MNTFELGEKYTFISYVALGYIEEIDTPNWKGKFGNMSFTQLLQDIYESNYSGNLELKALFISN